MLQPISNLLLATRIEAEAEAWVLASGHTGTFVAFKAGKASKPTAGGMAMPVWSESNRDLKGGFSPDIAATGKVTLLYGKVRCITDQFVGTPAVGDPLYVDADGKLTASSAGNAVVVAYCVKAKHTATYLSKNFDAIEITLA